ncbi:threonine/serine ThrE exporter family protein [Streptococcus halichoeri]|uniref:threonine/serine ThrE exporter family protein n=1 Tax=Streptococcus halichoeri TaxID=254785 RepID=UPI001359BD1F|nr:threonine/serine exporter family protein [Streptococcus halichoeri]
MTQTLKNMKRIVDVAALAGITMLEANAESYRVEDTVDHILELSQQPMTEVFANTTGLFITLDGPDLDNPITVIKRITKRNTNLRHIHMVNQISRDLTSDKVKLDEAYKKLQNIDHHNYSLKITDFSIILLVLSFVILFGGGLSEMLLSLVAAFLMLMSYRIRDLLALNDFIFGVMTTMIVATVIPILIHAKGSTSNPSFNIVIISVLMPLFPGTAFTNGFRDSIKGDFGAGVSKIVEALIIAVSLGLGVAIGLSIAKGVIAWL